jgi:hypothetical protein
MFMVWRLYVSFRTTDTEKKTVCSRWQTTHYYSRCISRAKSFRSLWNLRNCKWRHEVCFPLISRN